MLGVPRDGRPVRLGVADEDSSTFRDDPRRDGGSIEVRVLRTQERRLGGSRDGLVVRDIVGLATGAKSVESSELLTEPLAADAAADSARALRNAARREPGAGPRFMGDGRGDTLCGAAGAGDSSGSWSMSGPRSP